MKQNIKAFWTLLEREFWENYKKWFAGASFLLLAVTLVMIIFDNILEKGIFDRKAIVLSVWASSLENITVMGMFIVNATTFFYLYTVISKERENNNLSFWRSLPPNDGVVVAAKVVTALIVIPLVLLMFASAVWIAVAAVGGLITTVATLIDPPQGVQPFTFIVKQLQSCKYRYFNILDLWSKDFFLYLPIRALWLAPLVGWLMFMQSVLKRNGTIVALASLLTVGILEMNYLPTRYVNEFTLEHVRYGMHVSDMRNTQAFLEYGYDDFRLRNEDQEKRTLRRNHATALWSNPTNHYLAQLGNWTFSVGLLLSALFFTLSVWLRKRHSRF